MTETEQLSLRLTKDVFRSADALSKSEHRDRSSILREAIGKGLAELKIKAALEKYRDHKRTLSEAALLAEVSVGDFMDAAVKQGIRVTFSLEELNREKKSARSLCK